MVTDPRILLEPDPATQLKADPDPQPRLPLYRTLYSSVVPVPKPLSLPTVPTPNFYP
jgi:hypothetical protein